MSTETRTHHPYSPSTLDSLKACPCYKSREDVINERAIAGTLAHSVVESREDNNELSDDDTVAAAECIDFVDQRRNLMEEARRQVVQFRIGHGIRLFTSQTTELKEVYLPIDDCVFEEEVWNPETNQSQEITIKATTAGYVDHALISHDRKYAELFDWKFGFWPVEKADKNLQGIAYCLGLFKRFPSLESIRFFFKQPHLEIVSDAVFTRAQVPELYLQVQTVVARAREARALVAKGDWSRATPMVPVCNFCYNLARCEKVLAMACKVGSKFYPLQIPESITPTMVLDKHQAALAMRLAGVMATWAAAFRSSTTDRVLRGDAEVPEGYILQPSTSKRTVVNPELYRGTVQRYVPLDKLRALDAANPLGFGAVEKAIMDATERGQKQAKVEEFQQVLKDTGAVKEGVPFVFLRAQAKVE